MQISPVLIIVLCLAWPASLFAQAGRPAIPTHADPVVQGIQSQVNRICAAHRERLAAIDNLKGLQSEIAAARNRFLRILDLPLDDPREAPPFEHIGQLDFPQYRIEKLVLLSSPGVPVPCNLYVPKNGPARKPVLLAPHGHGGRDWPSYQNAYQRFAKAGFMVLAKDGWGRQERRGTGHESQGGQLFLTGSSLMSLELWDNVRCIDYLLTRDDVHPDQIGMVGTSGGGSQTLYAAAVDGRIRAASPTCAVTSFQADLADTNMCVCEINYNILSAGDHDQFLAMAYPRAWLVVNGTDDYIFPIAGTRESVASAQRLYSLGDQKERIALREFPVGHAWNNDMLDAQIRFFREQFGLGPLDPLPAADGPHPYALLRCLPDGEIPHRSLTINTFNRQRMQKFAAPQSDEASARTVDEDRRQFQELIEALWSGEPVLPMPVISSDLPPQRVGLFDSKKLSWASGLGGNVSAIVSTPGKAAVGDAPPPNRLVIRLFPEDVLDRVSRFYWTEQIQTKAVVAELSYTGKHLTVQQEGESGMALLSIGKSLLAERVRDLLVLLQVLEQQGTLKADTRLLLTARGYDGLVLLAASPFLPERAELMIEKTPISYVFGPEIDDTIDQLRSETSHWTVLPGYAREHDLLELLELAETRRVTLFHPLDAAWQPPNGYHRIFEQLSRTDLGRINIIPQNLTQRDYLRQLNRRVTEEDGD